MTRSPSEAVQKEAGRSGDGQGVQIQRGKRRLQGSFRSLNQQDGVTDCFHADGTAGPRWEMHGKPGMGVGTGMSQEVQFGQNELRCP